MSKVIVISFDRWQAGFLGMYGNPWVDTPALDAFAVGAAVFDRHFAENLSDNAAEHAWWTGRYQFPLTAEQQQRESTWLPLLGKHQIASYLLYDPTAKIPLRPQEFTSARAVSLDDVPNVHFEQEAPQFVKTALQRIRKMGQQPDRSELFWIHASGLPVDAPSLAYDDLYGDVSPTEEPHADDDLMESDHEDSDPETLSFNGSTDDEQFDDEGKIVDSDSTGEVGFDGLSTDEVEPSEQEEEMIVFPPRFWRRARSSPRELADASLRGAGWDKQMPLFDPLKAAAGDGTGENNVPVDWQLRRDLYTAQVTQWDAWVGKIIEAAQTLAETSSVMIVFTAGAGEHLGEHLDLSESPVLFEESLHAPLAIHVPRADPFAGRRLQLTTAADLPATILDWFQVPLPEATELDGLSLLPVIQQDQDLARPFVLMGSHQTVQGVRTPEFYYRQNLDRDFDGEGVFVKPDDRWDFDNMVRQLPDAAESLRAQWQSSANQIRERSESSKITKQ